MQKVMYNSHTPIEKIIDGGTICGNYVFQKYQYKVFIFRLDAYHYDRFADVEEYKTYEDSYFPCDDVLYFDFSEFEHCFLRATDEELQMLRKLWNEAKIAFRREGGKHEG